MSDEQIERVARALWEQWGQHEIRVCEEQMPEIARAALSAISPSEERLREGWQPIETAPQGGRAILGFMWIGDAPVTRVLHWDEEDAVWNCQGVTHHPTHWQQLPTPPGVDAPNLKVDTSEEVVERVARALNNHHGVNDQSFDKKPECDKEHWRGYARAALSAISPSEELREVLSEALREARRVQEALKTGHRSIADCELENVITRLSALAIHCPPEGLL